MGKRGHSEEEILRVLREAESGDIDISFREFRSNHRHFGSDPEPA
jgi:hypothetical protein